MGFLDKLVRKPAAKPGGMESGAPVQPAITPPIQIFLRHCYRSPNAALPNRTRPPWFDKEAVLRNFKRTIDPRLASFRIVYDNHFGPRSETFLAAEDGCIEITAGTEAGSFLATLDLAMAGGYSDDTIVYFLEDDYLHREGWCPALLEGFGLGAHYVSLYDHADKYTDLYQGTQGSILVSASVHWRAAPSTCNTYAARMRTLREDLEVHRQYSIEHSGGVSRDHDKFVDLWKRGRTLITPMPGYSTHCDHHLSPVIDWEAQCW